jgi:hypothetical protein
MDTKVQDLLNTVIQGTTIRYKGCIIHKTKSGYTALGKPFLLIEEAKEKIDNAFQIIKQSI